MKFAIRNRFEGEKPLEYQGTAESQAEILHEVYRWLTLVFMPEEVWLQWIVRRYGIVLQGAPSESGLLGLLADLRDDGKLELCLTYVNDEPVWDTWTGKEGK